jgi:hypothetical protein
LRDTRQQLRGFLLAVAVFGRSPQRREQPWT